MINIAGIIALNDTANKYGRSMVETLAAWPTDTTTKFVSHYGTAGHHISFGASGATESKATAAIFDGFLNCSAKRAHLTIALSGRIHNLAELQKSVVSADHNLAKVEPAELIGLAWLRYGSAMFNLIQGSFAVALWDERNQKLTLARDRMGVQPLLWLAHKGVLVFASKLSALLGSGVVSRVLEREALFEYLLQGAVVQPNTMIRNVKSIVAGSTQEFLFNTSMPQICRPVRYWTFASSDTLCSQLSKTDYSDLVKTTRRNLELACRKSISGNDCVGSFLSGGVDSTVLTALAAENCKSKIKSFSLGFAAETGMSNELSKAAVAAQHIGTEHTEIMLSGFAVAKHFNDFVKALDQPSVDGLNSYWVMKIAAEHGVPFAMSGVGGDELFAGYGHFNWAMRGKRSSGTVLNKLLGRIFTRAYRNWPRGRFYLNRFRHLLPLNQALATLRKIITEQQLRNILDPSLTADLQGDHIHSYIVNLQINEPDKIRYVTQYECHNYLVNTLLRDTIALSLNSGVEVSTPFLCDEIVEYAYALPAVAKWRNGCAKAILKDATNDLLPAGFFDGSKKGFTVPTSYWVENELREIFHTLLHTSRAATAFESKFWQALLNDSQDPTIRMLKWPMLVLLQWLEIEDVAVEM